MAKRNIENKKKTENKPLKETNDFFIMVTNKELRAGS